MEAMRIRLFGLALADAVLIGLATIGAQYSIVELCASLQTPPFPYQLAGWFVLPRLGFAAVGLARRPPVTHAAVAAGFVVLLGAGWILVMAHQSPAGQHAQLALSKSAKLAS